MMYLKNNENYDLFNELADMMNGSFARNAMKTDITEDDKAYTVMVNMPGVDKKDVTLNFEDKVLTLNVSQKKSEEEKNKKFIRKERFTYNTQRSYYLEAGDEANIKAHMENGVLTVVVNKIEPKSSRTTICIE